ncbi:MAG: N-(5'-phosphoribosyl)anthranilate isomerase [Chlamydiae bacterium]|nr:N-(5'-phosphoribosyl)anthranilate isomerase [Chlamydiota bacterium]
MKVKICGITDPEDAKHAARCGADYIGIIFARSSKRCVSLSQGRQIARIARKEGAEPVGIFADETADEIFSICRTCEIKTIQLHGEISQKAFLTLRPHFFIIYAVFVESDGTILPGQNIPPGPILLFDSPKGGSGKSFAFEDLSLPKDCECFLAGGLNPNNISRAIELLNPDGVDVASGVEYASNIRKDPELIENFIQAAKKIEEEV